MFVPRSFNALRLKLGHQFSQPYPTAAQRSSGSRHDFKGATQMEGDSNGGPHHHCLLNRNEEDQRIPSRSRSTSSSIRASRKSKMSLRKWAKALRTPKWSDGCQSTYMLRLLALLNAYQTSVDESISAEPGRCAQDIYVNGREQDNTRDLQVLRAWLACF